ncbi:MAG: hypothetical protein LBL46_01085 [Rickettsiales bacterium]|jgi:hypothetical protein|nr:hypothetical protein [Rickettsiales bacterium]
MVIENILICNRIFNVQTSGKGKGMTTQIIFVSVAGLLVALLPLIWLQSRRAERVMRAMQTLLLEPNRAKLADARTMIEQAMDGATTKIAGIFNSLASVLAHQISRAENLEKKLGVENKLLVQTADGAALKVSDMARALENLVGNLSDIIARPEWKSVQDASDKFNSGANILLKELEQKANAINRASAELATGVAAWSENGRRMSDQLQKNIGDNTEHMNLMAVSARGLKSELSGLQATVIQDFENVRVSGHGIEGILTNNEKLLSHQLEKMENFTDQAKKLLQAQVNSMADASAKIGTDIRLAESSIGAGVGNLNDTTDKLFITSKTIKEAFDAIAGEIVGITAKFQNEVGEFSEQVVAKLNEAQNATTHTMQNSGQIAHDFKDKIVPMLFNINETVKGLEAAKDRIQPLSELVQKLDSVLPKLAEKSGVMTEELTTRVGDMSEKINDMNAAAENALRGIGDSTILLEKLSGESRQQMIDLMADYAKAANTMRELSGNMADARDVAKRATDAAMKDIRMPMVAGAAVPVQDFIKQVETIMEKLHDLSVDLTRSVGAEIPDSIMEKYSAGDRAIFSKWFAKMISNADKKKVRGMFRDDAVFRSQATQFVHGFAKMLAGAERTENRELVSATLLKTDLGIMYQSLRACLP